MKMVLIGWQFNEWKKLNFSLQLQFEWINFKYLAHPNSNLVLPDRDKKVYTAYMWRQKDMETSSDKMSRYKISILSYSFQMYSFIIVFITTDLF